MNDNYKLELYDNLFIERDPYQYILKKHTITKKGEDSEKIIGYYPTFTLLLLVARDNLAVRKFKDERLTLKECVTNIENITKELIFAGEGLDKKVKKWIESSK